MTTPSAIMAAGAGDCCANREAARGNSADPGTRSIFAVFAPWADNSASVCWMS